jgi:hypothetical protein
MFTVLSNTRNTNLYIVIALAITLVVFLAFAGLPSIAVTESISIPVTGSQNAYAEFLSGEKVMYTNPARLSEALSAYHLGEKAAYANAVEWTSAFSTYLAGEKAIYTNSVDSGNALSVWNAGEKAIVQPEDVEAALWTYRMGEKGLK